MQLVCNHGEPGTYLCMVFQRDCLGKISTNLLTTSHNSNQVIQQAILHDFKKISVLFTAGLFPLMLLWLTIEGGF